MAVDLGGTMSFIWAWVWDFIFNYFWYIGAVIAVGIAAYKHKMNKFYKYKVRAFRRREDNKRPEENYIAGYGKDKAGIVFFRIKTGKKPWEYRDMYELPDPRYMDEDNRVYYEIVNPDLWIQVKRSYIPDQKKYKEIIFIQDYGIYKKGESYFVDETNVDALLRLNIVQVTGQEKIVETTDITYKPITSGQKRIAVAELWDVRNIVNADTWKSSLPWIGGAVLILGAGLLVYLLNTGQLS